MKEIDKPRQNDDLLKKQKEVLGRIKKRNENLIEGNKAIILGSTMIKFRCSKTKEIFVVVLKKDIFSREYEIIKIIKENVLSQIDNKQDFSSKKSSLEKSTEIDINKVSAIECPYCGSKDIIKCGCGKLSCGGETEKDSEEKFHKCPWCEEGGYVQGTFQTITGEEKRAGKLLGGGEEKKILDNKSNVLFLNK